jgi:hypothetical protein
MSKAITVVLPPSPEEVALTKTCDELALQAAISRFEIAVKNRVTIGIRDDNELRQVDEILHKIVANGDSLEAAVKPAISAAHARHKALLAIAAPFKMRWAAMRISLENLILGYNRQKAELARRQQAELDKAAAAQKARDEEEARNLLRQGELAKAQEIIERSQMNVAPVIMPSRPVLDHSTPRTGWFVGITDPMEVVKGIVAGTIPLSVIKEWDMGFLKREATKRGGLNWPGITAEPEDKLSVRR